MSGNGSWADTFSRGYSGGRAIANDFVSGRLEKKAAELREEMEAEAAANGTEFDYEAYQRKVRQLSDEGGVTRRNVRGEDGAPIQGAISERVRQDLIGGSRRRAGRESATDVGGALSGHGRRISALGELEPGLQYQRAGDVATTTKGALNADGSVDEIKLSGGLTRNAATYGDAAGTAQGNDQMLMTRLKVAQTQAGILAQMMEREIATPGAHSQDEILARGNAMFEALGPMAGNVRLGMTTKGEFTLVNAQGQPVGDVIDQRGEAFQLLSGFVQDPAGALKTYMQTQMAAAAEDRGDAREREKAYETAKIDIVKELAKADVSSTTVTQLLNSRESAGKEGWSFEQVEIQEDGSKLVPGTYNGKAYLFRINDEPDIAGNRFTAIDPSSGQPVPLPKGTGVQAGVAYVGALSATLQEAAVGQKTEQVITSLQLLDQLQNGSAPTRPGKAGKPPEPPPEIREVISAAAKKHGVPEELAFALAWQESSFNPKAYNGEHGAAGLFQITPETAEDWGVDPLDPAAAADASMRRAAERYAASGSWEEVIAAHFAGDAGNNRGPKTRQYVADVMAKADAWGKLGVQAPTQPAGTGAIATGPAAPPPVVADKPVTPATMPAQDWNGRAQQIKSEAARVTRAIAAIERDYPANQHAGMTRGPTSDLTAVPRPPQIEQVYQRLKQEERAVIAAAEQLEREAKGEVANSRRRAIDTGAEQAYAQYAPR